MAKKKAKSTGKKKNPEAKGPEIILPDQISDVSNNPRQLRGIAGANSKDFEFESASEPKLEVYSENVARHAEYLSKNWQDRIQTEGKVYYTCPMCTGVNKPKEMGEAAKKKIENHIKKEHKMRVKELKIVKAPKAAYTPEKKIESPKRTLADAVHPKYRKMVEAQLNQQKLLAPISQQAKNLSVHGNALLKLVTMTESAAISQIKGLSDDDLIHLVQLASNRGKRLLSRAARQMCVIRRISPVNGQRDPSERQIMIQEALRKAHATTA